MRSWTEWAELSMPELLTDSDIVDLRDATKREWHDFRFRGWRFAVLLGKVATERSYLGWCDASGKPYGSLTAWAADDVGIENEATVSRYATAGRLLATMDDAEREHWLKHEVFRAYEVMKFAKANDEQRKRALEWLDQGLTQAQLRQVVKEAQPDQHYDTSGHRTIKLAVTADTYDQWQRAWNIARYQACEKNPSDDTLTRCLALAILNEPLAAKAEILREQIEAGEARCKDCGSWDSSELEGHHVLPRSHQGHEGPIVALCHACHQSITENRNGRGWREAALEWGIEVEQEDQ
jgi:hypothetical protein